MNTNPSVFEPFAQIMRDTFATKKPAMKDGAEVAVYYGWQQGFGTIAGFPPYNLIQQVGIHPAGSTVGADTLAEHGYSAPDMYASRSADDNGELLAN